MNRAVWVKSGLVLLSLFFILLVAKCIEDLGKEGEVVPEVRIVTVTITHMTTVISTTFITGTQVVVTTFATEYTPTVVPVTYCNQRKLSIFNKILRFVLDIFEAISKVVSVRDFLVLLLGAPLIKKISKLGRIVSYRFSLRRNRRHTKAEAPAMMTRQQ